ncbi:hypothetical protein CCHR01_07331 [Colletotrichum chrysophilum]|uniref:Uncharacterized protein n=1 Tax=Colletotrichum chrysophilum TaxID=1836956 RepID=A0AAD9EJS0_9PEZI|nr:hypothetical protein CCHR01_07331 [Colletotrichum chrysophilum]
MSGLDAMLGATRSSGTTSIDELEVT